MSSPPAGSGGDDSMPQLLPAAVPRRPNFSGEWVAVSHDNLEALLRAQGLPEANIPRAMAASSGIRQHIRHT
jgi:hypothetical protein